MKNKYEIGDKVKNIIHGITGIVMAYTFYSTGCVHYGLQEQDLDEDGDPKDWKWYDETKLKLVKRGAVKIVPYSNGVRERNGGPAPNAPQG